MKKRLLIFIIFITFPFSLCLSVSLNQYGHIVSETHPPKSVEYFFDNGEYLIEYNNTILKGNTFFETELGFLTLTTIEENVPTTFRIYKRYGDLCFEKNFRKVINIRLSDKKNSALFFDGEHVVVINLTTYDIQYYQGSTSFSIDNNGNPIYYNFKMKTINYKNHSAEIENYPLEIILFIDNPIIFTKKGIKILKNNKLEKVFDFEGIFFEAKLINEILYFVEKKTLENKFHFILYKTTDLKNFMLIGSYKFIHHSIRTHQPIMSPLNYGAPDYPFPIGNSYAEIQQYGTWPYLHPGVDFLGDDFQDVYAVKRGVIKAILTTGGPAYWRIGIANINTPLETEGYLYAHLNEDSIPFSVGEMVNPGDFIGTLYPWGWYDFTHIHFARIKSSGTVWNGDWWTTDNPHIDVTNIQDTIPPEFENAIGNDLFAFRTADGIYLDPMNLLGKIDIIAKCHDIANSSWRIDVWELSYKLHPIANPDSTIFEKFAFAYDMPLDTYITGTYDWMVLNTIYSRDATCYSIGNYTEREYYHIITNSDGDSVITEEDAEQTFNTSDFPDGEYILEVIAKDASMNETSASMIIEFYNAGVDESYIQTYSECILFQNYPNPFSPYSIETTTISFLATDLHRLARINIYNIKGQLVRQFKLQKAKGKNYIEWDGKNQDGIFVPTGIYFYKLLLDGKSNQCKKMIVMR